MSQLPTVVPPAIVVIVVIVMVTRVAPRITTAAVVVAQVVITVLAQHQIRVAHTKPIAERFQIAGKLVKYFHVLLSSSISKIIFTVTFYMPERLKYEK